MKYKILLFIPVLFSVIGCEVINPVESVPTYVKIDSFSFVVDDPSVQGSAAQNITNVWIYYNNGPVGNYDLPCTAPVITEGESGTISVAPGIALNGLVDLQPQYPFFRFDTMTLATKPGEVVSYTPVGRYIEAAKFPYKEDFEVGNSFNPFVEGAGIETAVKQTRNPDYVFEGTFSGVIELSEDVPWSESIMNTGIAITPGEAFLEINYKGTADFSVGLFNTLNTGIDAYQYFWGVKASDTWKKIYIELAGYTSNNPGKDYKLIIKSELPQGQTSAYVAIDNVKIVSF